MKTVKISEETHQRLTRIGAKNETFDDIIVGLLTDQKHLASFKAILEVTREKIETSKRNSHYTVPVFQAADELVQAIDQYIADVESR